MWAQIHRKEAPRASPEISEIGSPAKTMYISRQPAITNSSSSSMESSFSEEESDTCKRTNFVPLQRQIQQQIQTVPRQLRRSSQVLLTTSSAFLIVPARNTIGTHPASARLSLSQSRLTNRVNYREIYSPQPRLYKQNPQYPQPNQYVKQMYQRRPAEVLKEPAESTHLVQKGKDYG